MTRPPRSKNPQSRHSWKTITPHALECTRCHHVVTDPQRHPSADARGTRGPPVRPADVAVLDPDRAERKKASTCPGSPTAFLHYEGANYRYHGLEPASRPGD